MGGLRGPPFQYRTAPRHAATRPARAPARGHARLFAASLLKFSPMSSDRYPFREIEVKWQRIWDERKQFRAVEDPGRPKFYCLEIFPYPSCRIHMGHVRVYAIDVHLTLFKSMRVINTI